MHLYEGYKLDIHSITEEEKQRFNFFNLLQAVEELDLDYDWLIDNNEGTTMYLMLRYENILIKNYINQQHLIPEIFVNLMRRSRGRSLYMLGFRRSFTDAEIRSAYVHSHLPSKSFISSNQFNITGIRYYLNRYPGSSNFCLGAGAIRNLLYEYNTLEESKLLLLSIKPYLEWESIGGMPYKYIREIIPNIQEFSEQDTVNINYQVHSKTIDFSISVIDGYSDIHISPKWLDKELKKHKCELIESNNKLYYPISSDNNLNLNYWNEKFIKNNCYIIFKGEKLYFQILPSEEIDLTNSKKVNNPIYVKKYEQWLKSVIKTEILTNYNTEGEISTEGASKGMESAYVPV